MGRTISMTLLGSFALRRDDMRQALHISGKTKELLARLATNFNRNLRRSRVMDDIWGDISPRKASSSLSTAVWRLNKLLSSYEGLSLIHVDDVIGLRIDERVTLDIRNIDRGMQMLNGQDRDNDILKAELRTYLETIIARPRILLEGYASHWALAPRERYGSNIVAIQTALLRDAFERGDYTLAIQYGRDILMRDIFREGTQREVMWLYVLNGQKAKAVQQYLNLKAELREELSIAPMEETTALFDYIRTEGQNQTPPLVSTIPSKNLKEAQISFARIKEARRSFLRSLNPA